MLTKKQILGMKYQWIRSNVADDMGHKVDSALLYDSPIKASKRDCRYNSMCDDYPGKSGVLAHGGGKFVRSKKSITFF